MPLENAAMDVEQYRKAYAAEVEKASAPLAEGATPTSARAGEPSEEADYTAAAIAILADAAQPAAARLAALQDVQAATFLGPQFDRYRASYREALRKAATDRDQELRARALELLAMEKDEVARQLLVRGLDDARQALVSAAKAVQLLAYDDHGVAVPMARKVLSESYDVDAKEEALRVLASDPASDEILTRTLSDKSQPARLRSVSASALRTLNPTRFSDAAKRIVMDEGEDDDVRATCLGALSLTQGHAANVDADFARALAQIAAGGKSENLRASAARFLHNRTR
jgi:hypothetical protein